MKIQNRHLANSALTLRYSRDVDDPSRPCTVHGDAEGIFEMGEKDAQFLLETGGWQRAAPLVVEEPAKKPRRSKRTEGK